LHEKRLDEKKYFIGDEIEKYRECRETGKLFFLKISLLRICKKVTFGA